MIGFRELEVGCSTLHIGCKFLEIEHFEETN